MGGVLIDLFYDRCVAAYLRSLKQLSGIDKDFLDETVNKKGRIVVKHTITMAKELNLKVIDSACRMYESFQMDFESHELQDLIGFSWADYSYAQQNSTEFISAKSNFSIFEDKQSRLCYEKLCSILFESNFEELTYFSSLDCNQNFIVDDDFARIKITDNNLDKINTSNNHQIKFARTEDDVIEVIQNYSENKSPLLVTVDVSFSKNEIVDKLPYLLP